MNHSSPYLYSHAASAAEPSTDFKYSPSKSPPPTYIAPPLDEQEHDDSTIKCICGFRHDDGNSVFCEKCNTWQHTECYYYIEKEDRVPNKDELEAILHFCADCDPRPLNIQAAINRQKPRLLELGHDERKSKKPASKSHKKKTKTPEVNGTLTNGWSHDIDVLHDRTSRSPRDHPSHAKKPKPTHRPSNSMSIPTATQNPTSHPHRPSGSTLNSPCKAPGKPSLNSFVKGPYNADFIHLYDTDPGDQPMQTNLLSDINITGDLSLWAYDAQALKEATRGFSHADVFHRMDRPLSDMMGPPPRKEYIEDENVVIDGQHPRWIFLKRDVFTEEKTIVGELKGKIGHMRDYIQEPANRWDYLRHPAPFVFFHPRLPIYIDTRSEGTICRYLRRSCRPNLIMTTFLENESEYHFCFTAKQDIPAGAELTIGWVLDEHMRKFNSIKNDLVQDVGASGEEYITDWVSKVLPEFGGCACGAPEDCWLSSRIKASAKGRNGSTKQRHPPAIYAMNSKDDSDREEERTTSESKSESRDMTPTGPMMGEYGLGLGVEISDREKRKIAALEKNFEQRENDKHQPAPKRKKRNSGGSSVNTPGASTFRQMGQAATPSSRPNTPGLPSRPQYADPGNSRRKSGSPIRKASDTVGLPRSTDIASIREKSSLPDTFMNSGPHTRLNYVSIAVQTEPDDEHDWYNPSAQLHRPKKPYMSLTKRLLMRSRQDRRRLDERKRCAETCASQEDVDQQTLPSGREQLSPRPHAEPDIADASAASPLAAQNPVVNVQGSHCASSAPMRDSSVDLKPPSWPSPSMPPITEQPKAPNVSPRIDLRLQFPTKPPQLSDPLSSSPITQTPNPAVAQQPSTQASSSYPPCFTSSAGHVQPSPAKKKVSLSDYIKRRGSHSVESKPPGGSPEMTHNALKAPLAASNCRDPVEGRALLNTPKKDEYHALDAAIEGGAAISTIKEARKAQ
ncbi:MAG: hypothetical protein Q9163_004312 [Psora crenata]